MRKKQAVNKRQKTDVSTVEGMFATLSSGNVQEFFRKGVAAHMAGHLDEASGWYGKVLEIHAEDVAALCNLGSVLQAQTKLDAAIACYQKAISIKPDFSDALGNLGVALSEQGKYEQAVACLQRAIAINPDYAQAHLVIANILKKHGQLAEAITSYQKALAITPDYVNALINLGIVYMESGNYRLALPHLQRAVTLAPADPAIWSNFAICLERLTIMVYDDELLRNMLHMLDQPTVFPKRVARSVVSALRQHPKYLRVLGALRTSIADDKIDFAITTLSELPLFLKIIQLSTIQSVDVEMLLTRIRAAILQSWERRGDDLQNLVFYSALAQQCFINDYLYVETASELEALERLRNRVASSLAENGDISPVWLAILGSYRPLHTFSQAKKLLEYPWPESLSELLQSQLQEPFAELAIRARIDSLTPIANSTSQAVRGQYEDHPYPRWKKAGLFVKARPVKESLQQFGIDVSSYHPPRQSAVLIAGCGTGHQAIQAASRYADSNILAVDLSLSSLAYAIRKSRESQFTNIEYMQGDILELGRLARKFDVIECRGVLHHMLEPLEGWQVLVDILRTGGVMKIGLYSKAGRQRVLAARALIAEKGYGSSPDDMRKFRQELIVLAQDKNLEVAKITGSMDFFSLSECRDLLFHVQEHQFTIPQIAAALQDFGLEFLGFELADSQIKREFKELYPEQESQLSLEKWHDFEIDNPGTFRNLYEFWVQKI